MPTLIHATVFCLFVLEMLLCGYNGLGGIMAWPSYCPHSCVCGIQTSSSSQKEHRTIECNSEGLTSPPTNMSAGVETLILSSNRIHPNSLSRLLEYDNLSELILAHNHIYGLGDISVSLPSLLYLNVDGNELDYLPSTSFWWVTNLHRISARNNKIELMDNQAFAGLTSLVSLDLTGNMLFTVVPEWFKDLEHLDDLNLSNNNIHVIKESTFHMLVSLRSLDLSYNQLQHVYHGAFKGLRSLHALMLEGNNIKTFPLVSLQNAPTLTVINMDHNPIPSLDTHSVANLGVTTLLLNHLDTLTFIDRHAFVNLTSLVKLELSNNKALNYIDPETFHNLPVLQSLCLHNNNLSVIEQELLLNLPSLATLSVNHNRLFCDCNIWWLIDEMNHHGQNLTLPGSDDFICDAPAARMGTKLLDIDFSLITETCSPRILTLFTQEYKLDIGDLLMLNCRAVGRPRPQIDWLLPINHSGSDTDVMVLTTGKREGAGVVDTYEHINISFAGTLLVEFIQGSDSGDYTCLASNPGGRDERTAHVDVQTNLADVIILGVTSHSVTMTWHSRSFHHHYRILYKQRETNETYHSMDIEPYMRSFTANRLLPETQYEFCIAIPQGLSTVRISCKHVSTRQIGHDNPGLYNARNYIIGGVVSCFILLMVVVCVVSCIVKKYNNRKRAEEELYGDDMSRLFLASMDSMSDNSPVTYENRGAEMLDESREEEFTDDNDTDEI